MRGQLRGTLGLAAVLAALLCSGCGGSASTSSTGTHAGEAASTTKAQFVAQAETICRTLSAQEKPLQARQEALKGLAPEVADAEFVSIVGKVVAYSQAAAGKLQALARPPGDAQAIEKLLSSFSQETTDVKAIEQAARKQESTPGEEAQDALRKTIDEHLALAEAYGMKDCIAAE
jgi:hypothetical protein